MDAIADEEAVADEEVTEENKKSDGDDTNEEASPSKTAAGPVGTNDQGTLRCRSYVRLFEYWI